MHAIHNTRSLHHEHRLDYWRQVVNQAFACLDVQSQDAKHIDCQVSWLDLGHSRILHAWGTPQLICRTADAIDADEQPQIILMFHQRGQASLMHQGRSVQLSPGCVVAMDTRSPYRLAFHDCFEQQIFRFPAKTLGDCRGLASNAAILLPPGFTTRLLLSGLRLAQTMSLPTGAEKSLLDLAVMAMTERHDSLSGCSAQQKLELARRYIQTHLQESELSSASVAHGLGISLRSLQKLFSIENDQPSAYILQQRLAKVHAQLTDPASRHLSIWHLASHWGFNDPSHFSRIFKQRYGLTPRSHRLGLGV